MLTGRSVRRCIVLALRFFHFLRHNSAEFSLSPALKNLGLPRLLKNPFEIKKQVFKNRGIGQDFLLKNRKTAFGPFFFVPKNITTF